MKCPVCDSKTRVTTTYWNKLNSNRRRRECVNCHYRFTTREVIQVDADPVPEDDSKQIPLNLEIQEAT